MVKNDFFFPIRKCFVLHVVGSIKRSILEKQLQQQHLKQHSKTQPAATATISSNRMFTHTLRSAARTITRKHTARYTTNNINNINSILEILVKSRNGSGLTIFGVIGTVYFFCGGQDRKLCNLDRKLRSLENDNVLLNRKIDALNKNFGIVVPNSQQQQQHKRPKESIERGGDEADDADTGTRELYGPSQKPKV